MTDEMRTKSYPENYPSDAMAILDAMSFSGGKDVKVLRSMSLRSQQYAGDYDAFEIVKRKGSKEKVLDELASEFQHIIKTLRGMPNVFIGDIKAGSIEEWRVIPRDAGLVNGKIEGYNSVSSKKKVDELFRAKVITEGEKRSADELLKDKASPEDFLLARKKLKFHIIRWSVPEVLGGSKVLRDGRRFTLQDAFSSPTISKLDTIGLVQNNKYTDFSIIYEFQYDGKVLNPSFEDIGKSLSEDIIAYKAENNPFKVLKREFALAKFRGDEKTIKGLTPVLNSDLGRLYSLLSDVGTLIALLEEKQKVPLEKVRYEIDQFKARMANVYSLPDFLKTEHTLLGHIASALKTTSRDQLLSHLKQIEQLIQASLTHNTKKLRGGTHRTDFLKKWKVEDRPYSLEELSKISAVPLATLQEVYNRGIGAYKTNPTSVRLKGSYVKGVNAPMSKKLSKENWALARVYSFLDGNPKHDNDLRLKGGAELDVSKLPPPDPTRDEDHQTKVANKLAAELKNAAHYFAYRAPATSLGYRVIADELFKKAPTIHGEPPRDLDEGHEGQTKKQMGRVIWGDPIPNKVPRQKTEFFSNVYKREVAPHFARIEKGIGKDWTHNEVQRYLETNV